MRIKNYNYGHIPTAFSISDITIKRCFLSPNLTLIPTKNQGKIKGKSTKFDINSIYYHRLANMCVFMKIKTSAA
jgi:hypothetical protein